MKAEEPTAAPKNRRAGVASVVESDAFRGLGQVIYGDTVGGETKWSVEMLFAAPTATEPDRVLADPDGEMSIELGDNTARFLFAAVTSARGLTALPGKTAELAHLLDDAANDPNWRTIEDGGALVPAPAWARVLLAGVARIIEETGYWLVPNSRAVETIIEKHVEQQQRSLPFFLAIPSAGHYAALQELLAKGKFEHAEGTRFPRARIDKGGVRGHAELRQVTPEEELLLPPAEAEALARKMWEQHGELSDKDADALDAVSACWLQRTRGPEDRVPIFIDEILQMRQLKPKRGGAGRRGGFESEQRADVFRSLLHLQSLWLEISDVTVYEQDPAKPSKAKPRRRTLQSRAFVMTDRVGQARLDGSMDVEAVLVTPGSVFGRFLFGPGRQVALLSARALRYHPHRQRWEKRLLRYLSWQWRIGASKSSFVKSFHVRTLLEEIGVEIDEHEPNRTRERFESCLDALLEQGDIAAWQYERLEESVLPRKGWLPHWLMASVSLEAPESIKEAYRSIERTIDLKPEPPRKLLAAHAWGEKIRQHRLERGLSQLQAAEELGVSQPYLSRLEKGQKNPSDDVEKRILQWLGNP